MCGTLPNSCASVKDPNKIWFLLRVDDLVFKLGPPTVTHLPTDMCTRVVLSKAVGSRPAPIDLIHIESCPC